MLSDKRPISKATYHGYDLDSIKLLFFIGISLMNNIVFVSGAQQSDSVMHVIHSFPDSFAI